MLKRHFFAQYELLSKMMLKYRKSPPPLSLVTKFEKALLDLRRHLEVNEITMPLPIYTYDPDDITTHSHIPNPTDKGTVPNPLYRFRHIWKRIDGKKGIE